MTFSLENCADELFEVTGGIRLRGNGTLEATTAEVHSAFKNALNDALNMLLVVQQVPYVLILCNE